MFPITQFSPISMTNRQARAGTPVFGQKSKAAKRNPARYVDYQQMSGRPDQALCRQLKAEIRNTNRKLAQKEKRNAFHWLQECFHAALSDPSIQKTFQYLASQKVEVLAPPQNKDLLAAIQSALKKFQSVGKHLQGLKIHATPEAARDVLGQKGLKFLNETNTIYINPGLVTHHQGTDSFWRQAAYPVPNLQEAVEHEMVHFLHQKRDALHYAGLAIGDFKPAAKTIAAEVSEYASVDPYEFVAETGVGLLNGKHYSPQVMAMYGALRGPNLKASPLQPRAGQDRA